MAKSDTPQSDPVASGNGHAQPERKPPAAIRADELKIAELETVDRFGYAEIGSVPGDYEGAQMWPHVSHTLNRFDRVALVEKGGAWWAEYLIVEAGKTRAAAKLLRAMPLPALDPGARSQPPDGYEVVPGQVDDGSKWIVIRKRDGFRMLQGYRYQTYDEALNALNAMAIFRTDTTPRMVP